MKRSFISFFSILISTLNLTYAQSSYSQNDDKVSNICENSASGYFKTMENKDVLVAIKKVAIKKASRLADVPVTFSAVRFYEEDITIPVFEVRDQKVYALVLGKKFEGNFPDETDYKDLEVGNIVRTKVAADEGYTCFSYDQKFSSVFFKEITEMSIHHDYIPIPEIRRTSSLRIYSSVDKNYYKTSDTGIIH